MITVKNRIKRKQYIYVHKSKTAHAIAIPGSPTLQNLILDPHLPPTAFLEGWGAIVTVGGVISIRVEFSGGALLISFVVGTHD